jgi:hypothetical protein
MSGAAQPWIDSGDLEAHLERVHADPEARALACELRDRGLAVLDLGEAGRTLCDRIVADTDPYFANPRIRRVQDAWRRSQAVRALALYPRIREILQVAYGRPPFPFQTLNFIRGSEQEIHADTIHFHSQPERFMCGVWIALEDIQPDSGPLTYYPGSHKLPVLTMRGAGVNRPDPRPEDYDRHYTPALAARLAAAGLQGERALLRKGQALIWTANLAHGGTDIAAPGATRRSLVVHYYFEDCVYFTPIASDVEGGRLKLRLPADIRTGGWVWPRRAGRRLAVRPQLVAAELWKRLTRQMHAFA